jgi:transcriptional regulator with XRE-family HTH domain
MEAQAFYETLGRRVQDRRKARGFTQDQLASRITPRVTRASIANIEAGKQGVLVHTLVQLASALDVAPNDLLPQQQVEADSNIRNRMQVELTRKLSVPIEESLRLTDRFLAQPSSPRRTHERSTRKSSR